MEGVGLENLKKLKPFTIPMAQYHYHLSDESYLDVITTATHLRILLQYFLKKWMIDPLFTIMCYYTDGCSNSYGCASAMYLL